MAALSSSSDSDTARSSSKGWSLDLKAFSKCKVKLETALRSKTKAADLLDTHCTKSSALIGQNPLKEGNEDGAHPMLKMFFAYSEVGNIISKN